MKEWMDGCRSLGLGQQRAKREEDKKRVSNDERKKRGNVMNVKKEGIE